MKAILIEEERFAEIRGLMEQAATDDSHCSSPLQAKRIAEETYRLINHQFVRWAQSHGASCVPR